MDQSFEVEVQPVGGTRRQRPRRRLLGAGIIVVAIVVGAGVVIGTRSFGFDRSQVPVAHASRIAFVDALGRLNSIDADGSNLRPFAVAGAASSSRPGRPTEPTSRPSAATRPGAGSTSSTIAPRRPRRPRPPSPVVVYGHSAESPIYVYWSPDGRRLAFLTNEPDGLALQTVVADGSGTPTVVRNGQPMYWAWVDDAHLLVHSGGDAQDAFLGEVGLDASLATRIGGAIGQFQAPGVSPSGDFRAYVATDTAGDAHVEVEARRGSTHFEAAVVGTSAIGWSPTGDQLAFIAPPRAIGLPVGSLRLIDGPSGATRTLLDGLVVAYFWAPDGRTIATLRVVVPGGQTIAAAPSATPVAPPTGGSLRVSFVDVATGTIRSERPVRLPDLMISQFLPFFDQYAHSHRLWSPTSDAIVLPLVSDAGVPEITILPVDGSAPRRVADGVAAFWSP